MIALLGMLIIVATQFIAPKVGVASPLILLGVGLAIGFLPQVGAIEIAPHIILEIILPPLLFSAAVRMPTMDFRREMQAVAMLAIPLVFISSFAIGFLINWMVPQISLAWGVALGAVLSPTDAVAVTIAKRSGVSHRIITVLEGEGLFNDATSLVLLAAVMNAGLAADNGALNPALLTGRVLVALGIAIVVGLIVGEVGVRIRSIIKDPSTDTVFSFAMPFIASIPAEHVGGSGLVAAVVAGLVVSGRRAGMISAQNRRFSQQNWSTMTLMLESGIFLAMGLQAFGIIEDADGDGGGLARAAVIAVIAGSLIMVIRALFIAFMLTWLETTAASTVRGATRPRLGASKPSSSEWRRPAPWTARFWQAETSVKNSGSKPWLAGGAASKLPSGNTQCADLTSITLKKSRLGRVKPVSLSGPECAEPSLLPQHKRFPPQHPCVPSF